MKTISIKLTALLVVCLSLSACNSSFSYFDKKHTQNTPVSQTEASNSNSATNGTNATNANYPSYANHQVKKEENPIRKHLGVSTYSVERLAQKNQCEPKGPVILLSEIGPIEKYEVDCQNGKVFAAICELRQCKVAPDE